jgi:hypothetical protein
VNKLKIYCASVEEGFTDLVATTSKAKAAKLMNSSIYRLETRGMHVSKDSDACKIALSQPDVLFKQQRFTKEWFSVDRAI